ncbi:hypothetical protein V1477_003324 [Vespula maculifrons]|uniref:Uncharacterized protein n=1 Tax=Vespula maculifrons TaxID=7453 RepID=A0ABD2CUI8_VESMC
MKLVENEVRSIASRTEVWLIPKFIEIIIEPSKCMFRKEETRDLNRLSVTDQKMKRTIRIKQDCDRNFVPESRNLLVGYSILKKFETFTNKNFESIFIEFEFYLKVLCPIKFEFSYRQKEQSCRHMFLIETIGSLLDTIISYSCKLQLFHWRAHLLRVLSIASLPEQELLSINVFLLLNYLNYSLICVSFMDSLLYTLRIIGMVSDYEWLNFRQTLNTIPLSIKVYKEYAALQGHSKSFRLNKEYLFSPRTRIIEQDSQRVESSQKISCFCKYMGERDFFERSRAVREIDMS